MTLLLRYAARSDRGLVRGNNEDSVYAGARLLALADGMGGHAAGEVASQLVIAALAHLDDDEPGGDLLSKLDEAVHQGNTAIAVHVEADPELEGMGTTLTAILFDGNRIGLVHVGDSRGYLLRDGELNQITKDDTFVQTLVDEGRITAEEAHSHPQRSLIMRALTGHEVEPTLIMREARVGDRYLLCSDGLSDPVSQETIAEALQIPDVTASADRLIELALRGGGPDNVTVVVADVVEEGIGQTQPILAGAVSGDDGSTTVLPNTAAGRASAIAARPPAPPKPVMAQPDPPAKPRSRKKFFIAAALVALLALTGLLIARYMINKSYYVKDTGDAISIMQGMPSTFLGISLSSPYQYGCINDNNELNQINTGEKPVNCKPLQLSDLTQAERPSVASGLPVGSFDQASEQLRKLVQGSLLPVCKAAAPAAPKAPAPRTPGTSTSPAPSTSAEHEPSAPQTTAEQAPPDESNSERSPSESESPEPGASSSAPPSTTTAPSPNQPLQEPGKNCRVAA